MDIIKDIKSQNKELRLDNKRLLHLDIEESPKKDIGIQLNLEDLTDFSDIDDIRNYNENLNSFMIEGKSQSVKWATVMITDILNKKLISDYLDCKKG